MQTQFKPDGASGVIAYDNNKNGDDQKPGRKPRRTYVCQTCQKIFKRREHCMRHERGHTKEKPYLCRYCKRTYARRDLVTRHEKSIHADQWTAPPSSKILKATANRSSPRDVDAEQDESVSSANGPEDDDADSGEAKDAHIPLTPVEMDGCVEGFSVPEGLMPSTPPSLDDILSLHTGLDEGYGQFNGVHNDFMETSPTVPVTTNPFDAFQAINAFDSSQHSQGCSPNGPAQYAHIPGGGLTGHSQIPPFNAPNQPISQSHRNSAIAPVYPWADIGPAQNESPSSVGKIAPKVPSLEVDDVTHNHLLTSMGNHLAPHLRRQFRLPSKNIIERCLASYLTCFHFHFPIVHIASLSLTEAPAPLIMAMCSIGALFRLERKHSINFREYVDQALASEKLKNPNTGIFASWPTWMAQCKLLSLFAAIFSGDQFTITLALQSMGSLTTEYRHRRVALSKSLADHLSFSWPDWIERETSKRICYGTFALSNLVNVTFGTTPRMSIVPDAEIEMPADERLWNAMSEIQWTENMVLLGPISHISMRAALNQIISGRQDGIDMVNRLSWSSFSATVIMHAMNILIWNLVQSAHTISGFAVDGSMESSLHFSIVNESEAALDRCSELFLITSSESEQRLNELEVSQRSNCNALLRTAYVRAASSEHTLERIAVLGGDPVASEGALETFIASTQHRSDFVTKAISYAYHGLQTSVRAGHLLVKKTAAFKWSIDHAIADWDCVLFVSRWIHTLERLQKAQPPNVAETKNLEELRQLLSDVEVDCEDGKNSLAAEVTRVWAGFFDDTWVWGITPKMAIAMRKLADGYEQEWRTWQLNE